MEASGFMGVPDGGPSWYRVSDNVLMIDAWTWNFIATEDGDVIPFDVRLQRPTGELKERIEEHMPE